MAKERLQTVGDGRVAREDVDAFLEELAAVCRKHGLSLDFMSCQVDGMTEEEWFEVCEFSEKQVEALLDARVYFPKQPEWF
jgi:sugar phosphate isomerase/epimerase